MGLRPAGWGGEAAVVGPRQRSRPRVDGCPAGPASLPAGLPENGTRERRGSWALCPPPSRPLGAGAAGAALRVTGCNTGTRAFGASLLIASLLAPCFASRSALLLRAMRDLFLLTFPGSCVWKRVPSPAGCIALPAERGRPCRFVLRLFLPPPLSHAPPSSFCFIKNKRRKCHGSR